MTGADMTVSSDWHFPVLLEFSLVVCMFFFFFPHMRLKCKKKKVVVNHFLVPDWTLSSLCHTCTHRKSSSALFALLSKHKTLADPAPNPPPAVSQGGETQTRARRALSTPQPLNTFSALPFENKPRRQAPVSNSRLLCEHTCPTLRWELFGDFPAAVPGSRCENGGDQA